MTKREYWLEWAEREVEVGNEDVIDAGGVDADLEKVSSEIMNYFEDYVRVVKTLNADSKELRGDIAAAISIIEFEDGDFEDYDFDVLTRDQWDRI